MIHDPTLTTAAIDRRAAPADDRAPFASPERLGGAFLMAWVWPALATVPLVLDWAPLVAVGAVAAVGVVFLRWVAGAATATATRRRRAILRLRPLAPAGWLVAPALVAAIAGVAALTVVYAHLVRQPPSPPWPWDDYAQRGSARRMAAGLAITVVVPVMEEVAFRGVLLTRLEVRYGAARAIGGAAALFALLHADLWLAPVMLVLGLAFGVLAWASESVWAAVLLHAGWNALGFFQPLGHFGGSSGDVVVAAAVVPLALLALVALVPRLRKRTCAASAWAAESDAG